MTLQEDYRVTLEAFEGPLDLLLYLIRRAEVDVTDIPITEVADQYLAFLSHLDDIDVDLAGDFLVMAATLIEIKSRTIAPVLPEGASGEAAEGEGGPGISESADPRFELVKQLLAYQRYRIASGDLDDRRREFARRFPLRPGRRDRVGLRSDDPEEQFAEPVELELEDAHLGDLADAYERIISSIDFSKLGDHVVEIDDTPIELHQEDLLDRLSRATHGTMSLQDTFSGRTGGERIGLFLATLELVRLRRVTVTQNDIEAAIELTILDTVEDLNGNAPPPPEVASPEAGPDESSPPEVGSPVPTEPDLEAGPDESSPPEVGSPVPTEPDLEAGPDAVSPPEVGSPEAGPDESSRKVRVSGDEDHDAQASESF